MWLRDKYNKEFDEIVDLVWDTWNKIPTTPSKWYLQSLKRHLLSYQERCWTAFIIHREDVEQELSLLWLKYSNTFKGKRTYGALREYLIQCSLIGMRSWFFQQISTPSHSGEKKYLNWFLLEFQLDLRFLVEGTSYWPLYNLSPYERYLIFLKFKEEKSIVDIAYTVQKHREVISYQLKRILNRLRSEINESKNTKRSSYPGPGLSSQRGNQTGRPPRDQPTAP